jgi:hypothetical protein
MRIALLQNDILRSLSGLSGHGIGPQTRAIIFPKLRGSAD